MQIESGFEHEDDVLALFEEYRRYIVALDPNVSASLKAQHYDEELADLRLKYGPPQDRLYLAMESGESVGCVALARNDEDHCEMKRLFVRPQARGRGVGRSLIARIITDARSIGYGFIRLDTFLAMRDAIHMYESRGFRRIPRYNDNPAPNAIFMERDLALG